MSRDTPAYDLRLLQQLVGQGQISRKVTMAALKGAALLQLEEDDIVDAVLRLTAEHFYKSMEAESVPGLWQDVYHLRYAGTILYIKLQMGMDGRAFVVQFKEK